MLKNLDLNRIDKVTGEKFNGLVMKDLNIGDKTEFSLIDEILIIEITEIEQTETGATMVRAVSV